MRAVGLARQHAGEVHGVTVRTPECFGAVVRLAVVHDRVRGQAGPTMSLRVRDMTPPERRPRKTVVRYLS